MRSIINTFAEILEQADNLTIDGKETLIEILKRKMIDYRRNKLINEVHDAKENSRKESVHLPLLMRLFRKYFREKRIISLQCFFIAAQHKSLV